MVLGFRRAWTGEVPLTAATLTRQTLSKHTQLQNIYDGKINFEVDNIKYMKYLYMGGY